MRKRPDRADGRPTSQAPASPAVPDRPTVQAGNGVSSHHALWWVVHYEGARDYAQSVRDAPRSAVADVETTARPPVAAAPARPG